jgi:hypothetical protein
VNRLGSTRLFLIRGYQATGITIVSSDLVEDGSFPGNYDYQLSIDILGVYQQTYEEANPIWHIPGLSNDPWNLSNS